ncbi:MAG: LamG domain-containing protein [Candidatus Omnitrophica bacterium]|nr:LamG domain-containing protein [Candidatus Omnitrophota bacterium]
MDGTDDFANCAGADDFNFRDSMTVAAWVKVRQFDKPGQALIAKGNDTWRLERHGDQGTLDFVLAGPQTTGDKKGKPPVVTSKRTVDDGAWHHVVGVYDGERAVLYLDGEFDSQVAAAGEIAQNTESVWIGENAGSRRRAFNGWFDDVRLYDRSLSADEIRELYQSK